MAKGLPFTIAYTHRVWEASCVDPSTEYTYILKLILIFKIGTVFVKPNKKFSLPTGPDFDFFKQFCSDFCPKKQPSIPNSRNAVKSSARYVHAPLGE